MQETKQLAKRYFALPRMDNQIIETGKPFPRDSTQLHRASPSLPQSGHSSIYPNANAVYVARYYSCLIAHPSKESVAISSGTRGDTEDP